MSSDSNETFVRTVQLINKLRDQIGQLNKEVQEIIELNKQTIDTTRRLSKKYSTRAQSLDTYTSEKDQPIQH